MGFFGSIFGRKKPELDTAELISALLALRKSLGPKARKEILIINNMIADAENIMTVSEEDRVHLRDSLIIRWARLTKALASLLKSCDKKKTDYCNSLIMQVPVHLVRIDKQMRPVREAA